MIFTVEAKETTAEKAQAQVAERAAKVLDALKAKVGAGGKIETEPGGYSLSPLDSTSPSQINKVSNWYVRYEIAVDCDPSEVPAVLDAAQALGVVGSSDYRAPAKKAMVNVFLTLTSVDADEATKRGEERAREIIDKISEKLKGDDTIKVLERSLHPQTMGGRQTQEIVGYRAANSISVETNDINGVGSLIDTAMSAGAIGTGPVIFKLSDDSKARSDAVADACKDAQLKATAAANALGLKVKRVMKITRVGEDRPEQIESSGESPESSTPVPAIPFEPHAITVPATAAVTYELE
jgi:uncharacterized protein YggE